LVSALCFCGLKTEHIGIISPYKAQLRMIRQVLHDEQQRVDFSSLEIHTVDRFQGRDKPCMLVSLVRSNTQGHVKAQTHTLTFS
jgi:DNA replication ATP-dependent helicase Dna2